MWGRTQKRSVGKPEEGDEGEIRLAREAVGHGKENPSIIATEELIQKELTHDLEDRPQGREGYGGKWLSERIHP